MANSGYISTVGLYNALAVSYKFALLRRWKWNAFIFKIQLVRQHHSMFSPLQLFNSSINSSMSKYNNVRSLTFLAEPQRISKQPSGSLLRVKVSLSRE